MNISVYLFGDLSSGYTQFPDDYSRNIFSTFHKNAQSVTQLTIHRDGDLMYYGYLRKLEDNKYIGLCTVVNGLVITRIDELFSIYENAVEMMVRNGYLICFSDKGEISAKVGKLYESREEIDLITSQLQISFNRLEVTAITLPPVNYSASKDSKRSFSIQDDNNDIINSTHSNGYTFVYKSKGYNTIQMNSYKGVLTRKEKELSALKNENSELKNKVRSLRNKQKNTTWVSVFAILALILGFVVWTQVLFPNEVTKKNMGDYVYYGPMEKGEPNGVGVAIYHNDDKDGRLYYYGNFTNGKRVDDNAIMFYKDGSYFKGSMNEDKWFNGLFFDVEKEHFIGEFNDNAPWSGDWYKHVKVQTIRDGH